MVNSFNYRHYFIILPIYLYFVIFVIKPETMYLKSKLLQILFIGLFIIGSVDLGFSQATIKGVIKDKITNEGLIGATINVKGTNNGVSTDLDGNFVIEIKNALPVTLIASYIGYLAQEILVTNDAQKLTILLATNKTELKEIKITDSRLTEKQRESALTVEAMDIIAIKQTPAANFYDGLGSLKGVDLTSASLGFKVINTRGFNSTSPVRSLQVIDGVDNQAPGLNFSLGNFLGCSELDILKVDLVVGASSAFYGPNAFNGVISMNTRSPFIKPGFEISVKSGSRDLLETAIRYAVVFKNKAGQDKLGIKFNACVFKAHDWEAENYSATPQSKDPTSNPGGFDAVNIYGDEYFNGGATYSGRPTSYPGLGVLYRTGYREKDLVDYNTKNTKLNAAFHYKIRKETELIFSSNFGTGTTVYQGDNRYSLKDILFFQNRIEIRKPNKFFLRAYVTNEDAGKSYDAFFTALLLQKAVKPDDRWAQDYAFYWSRFIKPKITLANYPALPQPPAFGTPNYSELYAQYILSINPTLIGTYPDSMAVYHSLAAAYANGVGNPIQGYKPFLEPGTYSFDTAFANITSRESYSQGGSKFFDKSALFHVHGEYKFNLPILDITVGSNYRKYLPKSNGTIFSDTMDRKITNEEWGAYVGFDKKILNEKVKLNGTVRVDKNQNFDYLFSPAVSGVYSPSQNHTFRVSFSSAIRNPTLQDQYLFYQVGRATLLGNLNGYDSLVTIESLLSSFNSSSIDSLSYFNVAPVKPEKVQTIEFGYRTTLFNHLYMDMNYYYSTYSDFIGYRIGADVNVQPNAALPITLNNVYRIASNSNDVVTTMGASFGFNYFFAQSFSLNGNWSWNELDRHNSADPLIPAFNTPKNKYNIGIAGNDIINKIGKNWGFNINYKWVDGFIFEGSPQFTGDIPSYGYVDAQINKKFTETKTTLKIGATNLLNNLHLEVYGGPIIGRLFYFQLTVELN